MRSALIGLMFGCAASAAYAQTAPSPADVGIVKQSPNVFKLLDTSKTWTPFGSVNENTHIFAPATNGPIQTGNCMKWGPGLQDANVSCGTGTGTPAYSETDILVTDAAVGMTANTAADNAPFIPALMGRMGGATANVQGYDVTFPALAGQTFTEYYFSNSLEITRGGNYHCGGTSPTPATTLYFAPGVDGVVNQSYQVSADGGGGGSLISNCNIKSMGYGGGKANAITNLVTGASFQGDYLNIIAKPTWTVGDGIILVPQLGFFFPADATLLVPPGTTVTSITSGGATLGLSNPISQSLGNQTSATAIFTQTGSNNFSAGDTIHVADKTYTFVSVVAVFGKETRSPPVNSVLIGANFAASAANLVAAINQTAGGNITYVPSYTAVPLLAASYASGVITFTSRFGSPNVNQYPSVYTAAGTVAGTFGGPKFTGGKDATTCPAPCTIQDQFVQFWQLPASKAFNVTTTAGSPTVTITGGPRLLHQGDIIWSDAFPFGTTVGRPTGTLGAQTTDMWGFTMTGATVNATVTHAAGSGKMWLMPAGLKRNAQGQAEKNNISGWPVGLQMVCADYICTGSFDTGNFFQFDLVGRWASGGNYSASSAINEEFANNYLADILDLGSLGEVYLNPTTHSPESGSSHYGYMQNCANQNYTLVLGGYTPGGNNGCVDQTTLWPPTAGSNTFHIGYQNGQITNGPSVSNTGIFRNFGEFKFLTGNDGNVCIDIGGQPNTWRYFAFSYTGCGVDNDTWGLGYNAIEGLWEWTVGANAAQSPMKYVGAGPIPFTGYAGIGQGIMFPLGALLSEYGRGDYDAHLLSMSDAEPTASFHAKGDTVLNTAPTPGGIAGWTSTAGSADFNGSISGTTLTVSSYNQPSGAVAVGQVAWADIGTAVAGTTITGGSGSTFTVTPSQTLAPGTRMIFRSWKATGPVSNDESGNGWTLGYWVTLKPEIISQLPACPGNAGMLAVVSNGAAPTYGGVVSTTGGVTAPVFCDGASWTYH